jgi:thymidine kinase
MTSGKSELLIMAMRNLRDRGIIYILGLPEVVGSTLIGTRSTQVPVRQHTIDFVIGRPDWEETYQGLLNNGTGVVVVMIDEVQFLIEEHVWALNEIAQRIAREHGIEIRIVFAGLAHDSDRREWSVIATIRTLPNCEESTLWAVCSTCGGQASETGRYDSETGEGLRDQPQIVLDGTSCVVYAPVCGGCYGRSLSPRQLSLLLRGVHPRLVAKLGRELPIEFEFGTAPHR